MLTTCLHKEILRAADGDPALGARMVSGCSLALGLAISHRWTRFGSGGAGDAMQGGGRRPRRPRRETGHGCYARQRGRRHSYAATIEGGADDEATTRQAESTGSPIWMMAFELAEAHWMQGFIYVIGGAPRQVASCALHDPVDLPELALQVSQVRTGIDLRPGGPLHELLRLVLPAVLVHLAPQP
jgi:hypothetical protein